MQPNKTVAVGAQSLRDYRDIAFGESSRNLRKLPSVGAQSLREYRDIAPGESFHNRVG